MLSESVLVTNFVGFTGQMIERIAQEMHEAALEIGVRKHFSHGRAQIRMIVGDDVFHAVQAVLFQAKQECLARGAALAIGQLHGQNLTAPILFDADRDRHCRRAHHAGVAHLSRHNLLRFHS